MISLWSITKLTTKAAIRSHIFQLLLAMLLICVIFVPMTISGDGTAYGYIQISLKYSLAIVTFILSLSTVWLGCFSLSSDIESYQLHMVISKPVSRIKIWIGKWLGVLIIHLILLFLAGMSIYLIIIWQFSRQSFTPEQKAKIESEVMVGRRVFWPERPDINAMAKILFQKRMEQLQQESKNKAVINVDINEAAGLDEMRKRVVALLSEIRPGEGNMRPWRFTGIPNNDQPLFLRFRFYVNKISSKDQRITYGVWLVKREIETDKVVDGKKEKKAYYFPINDYPQQYMSGVFHEITLWPGSVLSDNSVEVAFISFDPENKPLFIQMSDGPKLLAKVGGFLGNYLRALAVSALQLIILAGLACAVACVMSMPTAVFLVFSYLLFGIFAQYLVGSGAESASEGITNFIGYWVSKVLLIIIIPMQNFEVSNFISNGELIEFSYMGKLFFSYFVLKALPLFLLGILLYKRREMGLVIRK